MSRSRSITNAIIAKLGADAELLALMPNGVYRANRGPEGATALVEVELVSGSSHDEPMFGGRAWEDHRYTVQAVQRMTRGSVSNVGDAAARIDALLEGGTLELPAGFGVMVMQRQVFIDDDSLLDERDPSVAWDVCGGIYQVMVTGQPATVSTFVQDGWMQQGWTQ